MNDIPIGRAIKAVRAYRGLSLRKAAEVIGMPASHLSKIENSWNPDTRTIVRIGRALNIEPYKIMRHAERLEVKS